MPRLRNEWRYSDPLEFKRIGLSRGELGDVDTALFIDDKVVGMAEDIAILPHLLQGPLIIVDWWCPTDVGDGLKRLVEDRDEAPRIAVGGPVVGEVGDVVMIAVAMDLARVATGERDAPEFLAGGIQTHEVVLVAHGDEERTLVDDPAVRPPVGDPACLAPEVIDLLAGGIKVLDIVLAIAIEDEELTVLLVQGPRGPVLLGLLVLPRLLGPSPLVQNLAIEGRLEHDVALEIGEEEDLTIAFGDDGETVGTRVVRAPFVDKFTTPVVDDDIVLHVVSEKDDMTLLILHNPMTIVDRRVVAKHAPVGDDAVLEPALSQQRGLGAQIRSTEREGARRARRGFKEGTAGAGNHDVGRKPTVRNSWDQRWNWEVRRRPSRAVAKASNLSKI